MVNGVNIKNIDIQDYRKQIGYVSQSSFIINGSIRDNLFLGNNVNEGDVSKEFIKQCLQ